MRLSASTRPSRRSAQALAPATLVGLLLLTGCGGAADVSEPPVTEKTTKPGAAAQEPEGEEPTAKEAEAEAAAQGAECMLGAWDVDPEVVRQAALGGLGALGSDAQIDTTGETWVTFDGTTMSNVYAAQLTTITMAVEGQTIVMTVNIDGTVAAAYTATDGEVLIEPTDAAALTTTVTATVDGVPVEIPSTDEAMKQAADFSGANSYTCDDTTLRLVRTDAKGAGMTQEFTRRG